MESRRWLFPFTQGVDMQAIDTVVSLAGDEGATLVVVSLIPVPAERWSRGARLEHIQQSKDFLEAVKYKAARLQVTIERYEDFTSNALGSITLLKRDLRCDSIVLVSCGEKEILLKIYEKKRLLENPPASLVLLRLPTRAERKWHMHIPFLTWLRPGEQQDDIEQEQDTTTAMEELSSIRTKEHHCG